MMDEVVRAWLGSTQLLSYFVGYSEHMDMRREAERLHEAAHQDPEAEAGAEAEAAGERPAD